MKTLKYLLLPLLMLTIMFSCKKSFLDVEDNQYIIRQQYIIDLKTTQQFLNGIYVALSKDIYQNINQIYPDLISDNLKPSPINSDLLLNHYNWLQTSSDNLSNMEVLWLNGYKLNRSCSFVVEKTRELSNENPEMAKQMQAEALSIRALMHFVLVNIFAQSYSYSSNGNHPGVPFVTSSDWNDPYKRNTVAEVYTGIISDLNLAISLFPSGKSSALLMNKNAAKALLARVYLFKEDWQNAKSLATEIAMDVPLLTPGSYPSKLFTREETEALFQIAPSSINVTSGGYDTYFQGGIFRGDFVYFLPTKDIADLLTENPNDSRKNWIATDVTGEKYVSKYPINITPGFGTELYDQARSYYQTLFRSSEMFLTVAEASAKMGDETTARTYLDAIRKRADPTTMSSAATGVALVESIHAERRKELAFEGLRMFDLLRWKEGVNRKDVAIGGISSLPYPSNKSIAPIPLIDQESGMQQNTGY